MEENNNIFRKRKFNCLNKDNKDDKDDKDKKRDKNKEITYGSSSDSDSDSDSDISEDEYISDNTDMDEDYNPVNELGIKTKDDRTIMAIKWFQDLVNKNKTNKMDNKRLLNIIRKEIDKMKKSLLNKNKNKDNKYKKDLKDELKYYDEILEDMEKDYNLNPDSFDIIKYLNSFEEEYLKSLKHFDPTNMIFTILFGGSQNSPIKENPNYQKYTIDEKKLDIELNKEFDELYKFDSTINNTNKYFITLDLDKKKNIIEKLKEIKKDDVIDSKKPNFLKVLDCNLSSHNKSIILSKINQYENLKGNSEHYKLKTWINNVMKIPFGEYVKPSVTKDSSLTDIKKYLKDVREQLDMNIYGHETTKEQLVKILAQTITNPEEGGNVFALQGPPGVGKTALINDGIAKALNRPYTFISLGGATDSSFLEGHDYTYEGSSNGRIVDILMQSKCMNPIIYFDELDKVSETAKGEEIINILMHLTDSTQNSHFNDKYFGNINFDLSKAIMIFSFNDESKVSRILRDRMKIIKVKGYKLDDKVHITRDYVLPKLIKSIGLSDIRVSFYNEIIEFIIDNYTNEGGVRKLKEVLSDILLEINLRKLEGTKINGNIIKNEVNITKNILENDILRKKRKIEHILINDISKIGVVNGLWANDYGIGGLIPIECCWIPAAEKLDLELTGMQGQVMKESMSVARTVSWRILPDYIKSRITERWKNSFDYGIHIHCPDGSTPKDGPSAGGAITTCLISLLTNIPVNNKIAMTGEINLKGKITAIGGLEEKLFGAKRAGVELVLCPKENEKDLKEIMSKFPNLLNKNFNIELIENIWQVLDKVFTEKCEFIKF